MSYVKMQWTTDEVPPTPPTPPIPYATDGGWDYWTTNIGLIDDLGVYKTNNLIAYYAVVNINGGYYALILSTNENAVLCNGYESAEGSIIDSWSNVWYYDTRIGISGFTEDCLLNDDPFSSEEDAVRRLISLICGCEFQQNYVAGGTYLMRIIPPKKIIRKVLGLHLVFGTEAYIKARYPRIGYQYKYMSDYADEILAKAYSYLPNGEDDTHTLIFFLNADDCGKYVGFYFSYCTFNSDILRVEIRDNKKYSYRGNFPYYHEDDVTIRFNPSCSYYEIDTEFYSYPPHFEWKKTYHSAVSGVRSGIGLPFSFGNKALIGKDDERYGYPGSDEFTGIGINL